MTDATRPDPDEPLVMSVRAAAKRLDMAPKTLRRHIKAGSIEASWLGGMEKIRVEEVRRAAGGLPRLPPLPDYKALKAERERGRPKAKAKPKAMPTPIRRGKRGDGRATPAG